MTRTIFSRMTALLISIWLTALSINPPVFATPQHRCAKQGIIALADGSALNTRLAIDGLSKFRGLAGISADEFGMHDAMLFLYRHEGPRAVWLSSTPFSLDIFYLDDALVVTAIHRNLNRRETPTATVIARHFLEMRSDSRYAKKIRQGEQLSWISQPQLNEIIYCY
ncbi:MAG: DUF192 domain-containing protein [Gammaproteobacteria bacterium]